MDSEMIISGSRIRRTEDNLRISGTAVVALGAWASVKLCFRALLRYREVVKVGRSTGTPVPVVLLVAAVLLLLAIMIGQSLHIYIGLSARIEAAGKRKTPPYLILSAIYLLLIAESAIHTLYRLFADHKVDQYTAALVIDLTLLFALINIVGASFRLRRMRAASDRQAQESEEAGTKPGDKNHE